MLIHFRAHFETVQIIYLANILAGSDAGAYLHIHGRELARDRSAYYQVIEVIPHHLQVTLGTGNGTFQLLYLYLRVFLLVALAFYFYFPLFYQPLIFHFVFVELLA